jgi:hypothetical protein
MTLSINGSFVTVSSHNCHSALKMLSLTTFCHYAECGYAGCHFLFIVMPNFAMPNFVMLNVVMQNVVMLNAVMLNVVMLNVIILNVILLNAAWPKFLLLNGTKKNLFWNYKTFFAVIIAF